MSYRMYVIGSFVSWLLVGVLFNWQKGANFGATIALLSVACVFWFHLLDDIGFGYSLAIAAAMSSIPCAALQWGNNASGYVPWWTFLWMLVAALVIFVVTLIGHSIEKHTST